MATGVRNRVAGGGGFGSGEHTHVHKEEKGDKARPGCPCELPWAEDTDQRTPVCVWGGVFKDLHEVPEHYQMEMVFLKRAPVSTDPPSVLPAHRRNTQQAARLQSVCAADDTSLNQDSHRK